VNAVVSRPLKNKDIFSWPLAALVVVIILALSTSSVVTLVALIACTLGAFLGPLRAVQAMMVATLIAYGNPAIIKAAPMGGVILRLVLLALVMRIVPTVRASDLRVLWPVWFFALLAALTSALNSPALPISLMKIAEFTLAVSAVLIAYNHLSASQLAAAQTWFVTVGITVIGLSALTLAKPALGAGGNGGLQGILNQPQALGIFMAPFAAWSIAGVLLMRRKASRFELWLALGTLVLIALTRARTAAVATAFGVLVVLFARAMSRRTALQARVGRPIALIAVALAAVMILAATNGKIAEFATEFAFKGTQHENRNIGEAFYESRGGGVVSQWQNFLNQPLIGNGFGVYPDGRFPSGVVEFWGIPISAPIEKGFLPTAELEEGGIMGASALALLILWLAGRAWRNTDLRWRAMFLACLGMNFGECVFLSPGGIGMFDWLLLALAMNAYRAAPSEPGLPRGLPAPAVAQGEPEVPAAVAGASALFIP